MVSGGGTGTPLSTPSTSLEANDHFDAVFYWDNSTSTWVNRTVEAQLYGGTAFTIFDDVNDYLYLGSASKFDMAAFIFANATSIGTPVCEYSRSDNTWTRTIPNELGYSIIADGDNTFDFSYNGALGFYNLRNWAARSFSSTSPHAGAPPDSTIRYWVRISAATAGGPTVSQIQMRPIAYYCTPTDVSNLLQLNVDFDATTNPTRDTVEDYISAAQSYIDFTTHKSWRLNYRIAEEYEFNIHGISLMERDVRLVTRLQVWSGAEWQTKTQGRTSDYFLVRDQGMIHFARYFLLPARFQSYNVPNWQWAQGEFANAVRISYFYGRDVHADREQGRMVFDIARKLAATDVINNHDYTILTISNADRVSFERKIENWKETIENQLERMISWIVL